MAQLYGPPSDGSVIPHELEDAIAADIRTSGAPIREALDGAGLGRSSSTFLFELAQQSGRRLASETAGRLSEPAPGVTIQPLRTYLMPSGTSIGTATFDEAAALITISAPHGLAVGDLVSFVDFPASVPGIGADNSFYVRTTPSTTSLTVSGTAGGGQTWHGNGTANAVYKRAWAWDRTAGAPYQGMRVTESKAAQISDSFPWDIGIMPNGALGAELTALTMRLVFETDGDGIDLLLADRGTRTGRITIDGLEAGGWTQADFTNAAINGNRARLPLRFADARRRVIEIIFDDSNAGFLGFDVGASALPSYPLSAGPKGARWMFAGDSFTEGAGSGAGWGYTRWVAEHLGLKDLWRGGVGSAGYVEDGVRTPLVTRYQQDIIDQSPDAVLIATGFNDGTMWSNDPAQVTTAAATIWDAVLATTAIKDLVIVGPWPDGGGLSGVSQTYVEMDAELRSMAEARGLKYISPVAEGWQFSTSDGTHPDASGHEYIGNLIAGHLVL